MDEKERLFGLDLIRACAIIFVVMAHGDFMIENTVLKGFPYFYTIDGVDLFFVLSGFLIGGILLKEISRENRFGLKELKVFWKRRWFRTLPNYYLILVLNYLFVSNKFIVEGIENFNWKFFFFLQNFSTPFFGFFWESWSLSVEEWFYIFLPLLLIGFLKFFNPKTAFLLTVITLLVLPLIYRASIFDPNLEGFWYDVGRRKLVTTRLDSIAYGLLAAWIYYFYRSFWNSSKYVSFLIGVASIALFKNVFNSPHTTFYRQVIYFALSPFSAMLLLPLAENLKMPKGIFSKIVTHISKISYSMYLINLALVAEVFRDNFGPFNGNYGLLSYFLYWFIVITASSILYKYFEKPFMDLRDKKLISSSTWKGLFGLQPEKNLNEKQSGS